MWKKIDKNLPNYRKKKISSLNIPKYTQLPNPIFTAKSSKIPKYDTDWQWKCLSPKKKKYNAYILQSISMSIKSLGVVT